MASAVDICNMALAHIGARNKVSAIDGGDTSVEAGHCATFFSIARSELLESHNWTWTMRRALLAPVTNPSTVWTFAYGLPGDMMSPMRVIQSATYVLLFQRPWDSPITSDDVNLFSERGSADFEIEGATLLTHEPNAVLLYTVNETDTTKLTAQATVALSYLLASYLAGPIIKGDSGAKVAAQMRQAAARVRGEAAVTDSNNSASRADFIPEAIARRS